MQTIWSPDVLGEGYESSTLALGDDPDGPGEVEATVVRRTPAPTDAPVGAVLYVHGFSDYFFQRHVADFWHDRSHAFYALDLRKCGRSRRPGQVAHFVSDLSLYFAELDLARQIIAEETGGAPIIVQSHSTGGLVTPLWLDHLHRSTPGGTRAAGVAGQVLNSPWFDLQGKPWMRSVGTQVLRATGRLRPGWEFAKPEGDAYGQSLHVDHHGEWSYETDWKPLGGFAVTHGWLNAVRRGHARLHRGLDVGVPSLVLRSDASWITRRWRPEVHQADAVLDVTQIARWAGCLGNAVTSLPINGAMHDVFLSAEPVRKAAFTAVDDWLA